MLRHPRRDRFAPINPERERREAAFADAKPTPGGLPENQEAPEYRSLTPEAKDVLRSISEGTHFSLEATVSIEHREKIYESPLVLDAVGDIAHPSEHVEQILRQAMEHAGISPIENESAGDAIAAWHDEKREKKLLLDEGIAKARAEILRNVTDDPEALLALIRSLEDQRKRYREFVENIERDTEDSDKSEGTAKKRLILRAEAAEQIQAMMRRHDGSSVEQWIKETHPEQIRYALDVAATEPEGNLVRRGINLLHDWRKRLTFGMARWNASDKEPEDDQKRRAQEQYFTEVEKHITGLKGILKEKLEERANLLSKRVDEEMRRGLSTASQEGIGVADIAQVNATQWDVAIGTAFTKRHFITMEDAIEEINAVTTRIKRSRGLKIHAEDFVDRASDALERMDELSEVNVPDLWQHAITEAQRRHKEVQSWIPDFLSRYDTVRPKLDNEKSAAFIAMATGAKDATEVRERLDELATMLRNPSALDRSELSYIQGTVSRLMPAIEGLLAREYQKTFSIPHRGPTPEEFIEQSAGVSGAIDIAEKELQSSRIQSSNACRTAGVPQKLGEQVRSARGNLERTKRSYEKARTALEALPSSASSEERTSLENMLRAAGAHFEVVRGEMKQLQEALTFIKTIPTEPEDTDAAVEGYCDYGKVKIYVNRKRHTTSESMQRTFDHEFGHLVIDALTERHFVLTATFDKQQSEIEGIAKEKNISADALEQMLETAAREWHLDRKQFLEDGETIDAPGGPEAYYRRKRWEELLMQYANYRSKAEDPEYRVEDDTEYSPVVRGLFDLLEARKIQRDAPAEAADKLRDALLSKRKAVAFNRGAPGDVDIESLMGGLGGDADAEGGEVAPRVTVGPKLADFKKVREQIKTIKNFLHTYPDAEAWLGPIHQNAKEGYEQYFRQFNDHIRAFTEDERMPEPYFPEEDAELGAVIQNAANALKAVENEIKEFDNQKMLSVANAEPQGKEFWLWFTRDIQWLSIMDYWTMATEGWEDIKRLWKRRGENARGKVGELLTGWIGDKVPYFGQLKHEFHRRQQSSEQEAVGVWEKALENVDSYKLIEDIPHVNNQDHLKAVMILLTKRGRLDWDDPELWKALSRFSHFKIPIHECHRDPILLEKWLQKVITDIWTDKDLYRNWKTTNEHSYDSERDKYAGVADFYSNAGLLGPQLEYMLKTFVEAKEKHQPIPDQVNPHLYEQLFLYAMERGKMTMQQKFFYLIQGLKWKIIPFDRLSIVNSKISTDTFPFIDFFYQHNHTEPEILELAESLIESPDQRFKPGPKTTTFLIEEVAHDEEARQRVTKVISRKGNSIDHEDIPMITGYMSQGGWNNFLIVSSGAIQRVTPEGLKNAYVGYNTMFKIYGMLAEKKAEDSQSLPPSDIDYLAERIVAYAHFDNVIVRQAIDNNNRPKLSLREIENETMPSGNNKKAKQYRDPMNELTFRVFDAYTDEISQILESQGKLLGPEDAAIEGATRQEKYKKYRNMFLGVDDQGRTLNETPFGANHKKGGRIFKMSNEMEAAMIEAVKVDKGKKMTDILRDMSVRQNKFINEGDEQLDYVTHKDDLGRQKRFEKANGDHGGGHH